MIRNIPREHWRASIQPAARRLARFHPLIISGDQISTTVMFLDPKPVEGLGLSEDRCD